ncbi:MAG: hypothetical protein WD847_01265 [Pirellulales bacterium]
MQGSIPYIARHRRTTGRRAVASGLLWLLALLAVPAGGCMSARREACGYACVADCVAYPDSTCFGYYPTCWRPWPAECPPCEVIGPFMEPAPPEQVEMVPLPRVQAPPHDEGPFPPLPGTDPMYDPDASPGDEPPMYEGDEGALRRRLFRPVGDSGGTLHESSDVQQAYERFKSSRRSQDY